MRLPDDPCRPAALDDPGERAARRALLAAPHMRPLARLAASLRRDTGAYVPDADPLDGGVAARVLLLLETPGPAIRATGFVSRDNPTPTARNIRRFAADAALARGCTVIWNTVPWTIHPEGARNRAPRAAEIRAGLALIPAFLAALPDLRCAILAGRIARAARDAIGDLAVIEIPHPSPTIVCTDPAVAGRIRDGFRWAASVLHDEAAS